jgi:hypothetical protein
MQVSNHQHRLLLHTASVWLWHNLTGTTSQQLSGFTSLASTSPTMETSRFSGRSCDMMDSCIASSVSASISSGLGSRNRLFRTPLDGQERLGGDVGWVMMSVQSHWMLEASLQCAKR